MLQIMDCLSELIYVINIENYELLYINAIGKELFHADNCIGKPCYKILYGREKPCSFCSNTMISYDNYYTWEYTNPLINRHFLLRDRKVKWKGIEAKIEIAFDITEKERQKVLLEHTLEAQAVTMECIRRLYDTKDLDGAVNYSLKRIGEFLKAERAYLFDIRDGRMFNTYEWCAEGSASRCYRLQDLDVRLLDAWLPCFSENKCVIMKSSFEIEESNPEIYRHFDVRGINSLAISPIHKDESLTGFIGVDNPCLDNVQNAPDFFQTLSYFFMSALRIAENEVELTRLSYHDMLTGAFNRNKYMADIECLLLEDIPVGVVYLDINGLKEMNDSLGHAFGDAMIKDCARRAGEIFTEDKLYRIGGDEFVILSSETEEGEFYRRAELLKKRFKEKGACAAAVGYRWADSSKKLQLLEEDADKMMYQDKREYYEKLNIKGGGCIEKNDPYKIAEPERLRKQIEEGRFTVYFQPKISLKDGSITGAEALVRYQTQEGIVVEPGYFLPVLKAFYVISQVDYYVLEAVCSKLSDWLKAGEKVIPVSVNISEISLLEKGFAKKLRQICRRYGVEEKWLEIEVAENEKQEEVREIVEELQKSGFPITFDRFGAFWATLCPIMEANYTKVKVDKRLTGSLIKNGRIQAVLKALVKLCQELNITAAAGGIETKEEWEAFKSLGFDEVQGYFISPPLPEKSFEEQYIKRDGM